MLGVSASWHYSGTIVLQNWMCPLYLYGQKSHLSMQVTRKKYKGTQEYSLLCKRPKRYRRLWGGVCTVTTLCHSLSALLLAHRTLAGMHKASLYCVLPDGCPYYPTQQLSASVRWWTQPRQRLLFVCLVLFAYGILEPMLDLKHSRVSHIFSEPVFLSIKYWKY